MRVVWRAEIEAGNKTLNRFHYLGNGIKRKWIVQKLYVVNPKNWTGPISDFRTYTVWELEVRMSKYRRYDPELKARVALEALQGSKTTAQLSREHDVSPDLVTYWTRQLTERAAELFRPTRDGQAEARIAELERLVGQLTVELAAGKKLSQHLTSRSNNGGKP